MLNHRPMSTRTVFDMAAWDEYLRRQRHAAAPWAYSRDYVTSLALEFLPRVCAELGTGPAVAAIARPRWWATPSLHKHLPDPGGVVLALRPAPKSDPRDGLLFIDLATGEWQQPVFSRRGDDLVDLAEWRWGISSAKAAWRLARICGVRRPMP